MNILHVSALVLGFASSLHCLGMCGPLVWMLPGGKKSHYWLGRTAYHTGRVLTYGLMGGILGLAGQGVSLTGAQQWLSVLCGLGMILWFWFQPHSSIPFFSNFFNRHIRPYFSQLMNRPLNVQTFFVMGFLNGLLPCGVVYGALAGALAAGNVREGILFMLLFGAGTVPALMAVSFSQKAGFRIPNGNKIARYGLLFAGLVLVLRGANLGIPYLSPQAVEEKTTVSGSAPKQKLDCCVKKNKSKKVSE